MSHLFTGDSNKVYQRASRAQRLYNKYGKSIPADLLLIAQVRDLRFIARNVEPVLFSPTPSQSILADELLDVSSTHDTLRRAVMSYLASVAPDTLL
jgi:hypothetical protein